MIGIIDGYTGEPNIYADDIGEYNISVWGEKDCVLPIGNKLSYTLVSNNEIKIKDGIFVTQGRRGFIKRNTMETIGIENGSQETKRHDLIVIEYSKDNASMKEKHSIKVLKGTEGNQATDPAVRTGNIRNGDVLHQMPLYRVKLDGINVVAVEALFEVIDKPLRTMVNDCFQSVSDGKKLVASAITDKKVPTDATATFGKMAENIKKIVLGSGNAQPRDVIKGVTFTNDGGVELTGTMPIVSTPKNLGGDATTTLSKYPTVGVKEYGGSIHNDVNTDGVHRLCFQFPEGGGCFGGKNSTHPLMKPDGYLGVQASKFGLALRENVLAGKTFTSANCGGVGVAGIMPNNGAKTAVLNAGGSYVIPAGYHNGSGKVTVNSLASQTEATAKAANISKGKTAWVNGNKITGTGPTNFRAGGLESNYAVSGLTAGKTYILSMAALENDSVAYISSGGTELRKVHAFSLDKYSGYKTIIITIMFTATAGTVTFAGVTLYDRNAWTLVEI